MSDVPSSSDQPSLSSDGGEPSTSRNIVPQQVGLRMGRAVFLAQDEAGIRDRLPQTLLLQDKNQLSGSRSVVHYLQRRAVGARGRPSLQGIQSQLHSYATSRLPELLTERRLHLGTVDKVFSSQWLNDHQVVCGTKCNTLFVVDVYSDHVTPIPLLQGRRNTRLRVQPASGIRAIELNPSKTLLATGGENSNSLAVYQLPMLDPLCVGNHRGHRDYITSIAWISDAVVVSGSWDGTLAVWEVDPDKFSGCTAGNSEQNLPVYAHIRPRDTGVLPRLSSDTGSCKVQAFAFNRNRQELAAVSLDGYFHLWKAQSALTRLQSFRLPVAQENTCLSYIEECSLYAVGFQSHVSLLDLRQGHFNAGVRPLYYVQCGIDVCSMSVHQDIITVGTGHGCLLFFDIRARKFLEEKSLTNPDSSPEPTGRKLTLYCDKGWVNEDDLWINDFHDIDDIPCGIYTHCYNWPEMKLFTGGGPLLAQVHGNYAGLWS
ncbi:DDB1- and CUL4-associated factor 12-like protein 2 [Cavia porcellus]|uniref:DDB1- and CUL4-associated factor 12-like protein 2 n=1 Tax=Cavia porcellus TaxID=10141 RepID=UPI00022B24B6|nr:DDB1- and CUL4-associated factor 12-like protein 2 [Cavia porcellus]